MKHTFKSLALLLAAGSICLAACHNETTDTTKTDSSASKALVVDNGSGMTKAAAPDNGATDAGFVTDVMGANMAEINAHTAAQTHASSSDVKMHAKMMLDDHQKLGDDLKAYAARKNMATSVEIPNAKKQMLDDLNKKKGKDWDKAYLDAQEQDHNEAIATFEKGQTTVTDPELKEMITKTLPTLRAHLQMVKDAQTKLK